RTVFDDKTEEAIQQFRSDLTTEGYAPWMIDAQLRGQFRLAELLEETKTSFPVRTPPGTTIESLALDRLEKEMGDLLKKAQPKPSKSMFDQVVAAASKGAQLTFFGKPTGGEDILRGLGQGIELLEKDPLIGGPFARTPREGFPHFDPEGETPFERGAEISRPVVQKGQEILGEPFEQVEKAGIPIVSPAAGGITDAIRSEIVEDIGTELINPAALVFLVPFALQGIEGLRGATLAFQIADNLVGTGVTRVAVRGTMRGLTILGRDGLAGVSKLSKAARESPAIKRAIDVLQGEAGARPLGDGRPPRGAGKPETPIEEALSFLRRRYPRLTGSVKRIRVVKGLAEPDATAAYLPDLDQVYVVPGNRTAAELVEDITHELVHSRQVRRSPEIYRELVPEGVSLAEYKKLPAEALAGRGGQTARHVFETGGGLPVLRGSVLPGKSTVPVTLGRTPRQRAILVSKEALQDMPKTMLDDVAKSIGATAGRTRAAVIANIRKVQAKEAPALRKAVKAADVEVEASRRQSILQGATPTRPGVTSRTKPDIVEQGLEQRAAREARAEEASRRRSIEQAVKPSRPEPTPSLKPYERDQAGEALQRLSEAPDNPVPVRSRRDLPELSQYDDQLESALRFRDDARETLKFNRSAVKAGVLSPSR
ncbi:hypothetical protein LCGC14_2147990, partial [marine sediment metagenome]